MHTNTKAYFVYLGRSLLPNESSCITAGITHVQYRDYLKIMEIILGLKMKSIKYSISILKIYINVLLIIRNNMIF